MLQNKLTCCICDAEMVLEDGSDIAKCPSCQNSFNIPQSCIKRLNRINYLRRNFCFKDAAKISAKLIEEYPEESAGYWAKFLCEYGIQYVANNQGLSVSPVKDEGNFVPVLRVDASMIPAVAENENYKHAVSSAPEELREGYTKLGEQIQRSIEASKAVMESEDKYDVFVLSRENVSPDDDFDGDRLYLRFKENMNFKVFYVPECIKDMDHVQKAASIVYAIKNSRLMISIFHDKDEADDGFMTFAVKAFSSVAEKDDEKQIFAVLDSTKLKIQQLPANLIWLDEFFDISTEDFMREISDTIEKILKPEEAAIAPEAIVTATAANKENLIKRAYMFLEDGEFDTADTYFDKILDIDIEEARAYIGKVLAQCKIRSEEEIPNLPQAITDDKNYKKALRFATPEQKKRYEDLNGQIVERIEGEKKRISEERQRITAEREAAEEAERLRRERQNKEERRLEYKRRQEPLRNTLQQIQAELAKPAIVVGGKKRKELQEQEETVKKNLKNLEMMFADIFD